MTDEAFIRKTLKLAAKGRGFVSPNPMVGAVLAREGRIISEGYHARFGLEHAEVDAINKATASLVDSTLYVNLEPCSHVGKQPPCTDRIIAEKIGHVVVGCLDPNPKVSGSGIAKLREHGIKVTVGVLEEACRELNAGFIKYITKGLPLVTLKIGQTIDGRITAADGSSKWITSPGGRKVAHQLRAEHDAILAGINTVLTDDPQLNVRMVKGPHPLRIVLDSKLRIPLEAKVLNDALAYKTIVATTDTQNDEKRKAIESKSARVWRLPAGDGGVCLKILCERLGQEGVTSMLLEGGAGVFRSFLRSKLVDRVTIFVAPKIVGGGLSALQDLGVATLAQSIQLSNFQSRRAGDDILLTGNIASAN